MAGAAAQRGPVYIFASFVPKPGREAELEQLLRYMVERTRQEPGCEVFDMYRRAGGGGGPVSFHLFERYKDQAAREAHQAADYYKEYRRRAPELLAGPIEVLMLEPVEI